MLCYRDMTFCAFHEQCADGQKCPRALTEEVRKKATRWWGRGNAPIAIYTEHPGCFKKKGE